MDRTAKVYVDERGGHYVKPAEVISSEKGKKQIHRVASLLRRSKSTASRKKR